MNTVEQQRLTSKEQFWYEHIQQAQASAQSLTEYAQVHSLNLKGLYNYRSKLRHKGFLEPTPTKSFVKASPSAANRLNDTIILLPNGIRIQTQCQSDALCELIKRLAT